VDLIRHAISHTKDQGGQFVLLGSGHSDPPFSQAAETVYKRDKDVKLLIFYSDQLSHLLYAAADFVLVPSMFEPCGLTQMIAMEYGALTDRAQNRRVSGYGVRPRRPFQAVRRPQRLRVRRRR
jgi:starch synthase